MTRPSNIRHRGLTIALLLLLSSAAHAAPPRLDAPAEEGDCPSSSELRGAIASQRGRDDFDRSDAPSVIVRVRRGTSGFLGADVSLSARDGTTTTRTIESAETCADLVRAAALSIAVALDEDAAATPKPAPPPDPPPRAAEQPRTEQPLSEAPPIRSDHVVATASALTSLGLLPRPAPGGGLAVRARIAGDVWLSARGFGLPAAAMSNEEFAVNLVGGGAGACVEPLGSRAVAVPLCAHVLAGAFDVSKAKTPMANAGSELYVAASLSAGVRARIYGPIHLEGAVEGQLPFVRPTYVTAICPVRGFEPSFAALALSLGAGISFH